jgi:hypothetical protein
MQKAKADIAEYWKSWRGLVANFSFLTSFKSTLCSVVPSCTACEMVEQLCVCLFLCMCVCVCERERKKNRGDRIQSKMKHQWTKTNKKKCMLCLCVHINSLFCYPLLMHCLETAINEIMMQLLGLLPSASATYRKRVPVAEEVHIVSILHSTPLILVPMAHIPSPFDVFERVLTFQSFCLFSFCHDQCA